MSDIDFDELDRAVNSLMQPKADAQPIEPADPTEPIQAEDSEPSAPRPKLAVKRRGQFMDVMHASSDMKQTDPAPKLAPRRAGVTLQPSGDSPATTTDGATEGSDQPAPVADVQPEPPVEATPEPVEVVAPAEQPAEPSLVGDEPLSTPFLADAKVDKRPLGGLQSSADVPVEPVADTEASAPTPVEPSDPAVLPAELQQDVLAVESDSVQSAATVAPEKTEEPAPAPQPPVTTTPVPTISTASSLPQSPPVLPVNDASDDEADSSIFDTEQYQPPIKHSAKRKSSWPVVLAIVMLVIIGTGGGIAFYLLSNGY